jgi:large subunit ribosomal protein L25
VENDMTETATLKAELRDRVGKGAARALRKEGRVPAVIYGDGKEPLAISLDPRDVKKQMDTPGFFTRQFAIEVGGDTHRTLARDLQLHPVKDGALHIDFLRIGRNTKVTVDIPVVFLNEEESPGLERGGVLNIVRHDIEVHCRADSIPSHFDIDLTGLDIGDSVHASVLKLEDGVELTITDRDFTIATIAAPSVMPAEEEEEEGEEAEEAEGEEAEGEESEGESEGEGESEDGGDED